MTEPLRALIVDDEPLGRATLRVLLEADPEIAITGECKGGREAVARLNEDPPDILFLDIQMPGMDGFEVLAQIPRERLPVVVFVTAFDRHAIRAFEVSAVDYLLKPFDDERFARALARAKEQVRLGQARELAERLTSLLARPSLPPPPIPSPLRAPEDTPPHAVAVAAVAEPPYAERLAVKDGPRVALLPVGEVDWIEAQDYYASIHARGQEHLVRESLQDLEARLDPRRFVRIHRSAIVNVERIRELMPLSRGESVVVLHDGTQLPLSRSRKKPLMALLGID